MTPAKRTPGCTSPSAGQVLKPGQRLLQLPGEPGNFNMRQLRLSPRRSHRIHGVDGLSLKLKDSFEPVIRDATGGGTTAVGMIQGGRRH